MKAVTHLEKVIAGEASAVTHLEKVIAQETTAVTYTEKVIAGEASPITHLQKVIAGVARPVTRLEYVWAGGSPPSVQEYTGAVPVTFVADGTPLLDYIISGNTVQTGTPTSDSPIEPEFVGERTENLFDFEQLKNAPSGTIGSVTFSHVLTLQLKANTYYTMASNGTGSTRSTPADLYRSVYFNATAGEASVNINNPVTVLTDSAGVVRIGFFSERTNAEQYLSGEAQLWINKGSTALPYEPWGIKIPISSANTITNVYLGEVETTRKIKKLVLTGEETSWQSSPASGGRNRFILPIQNAMQADAAHLTSLSTHLPLGVEGTTWGTDDVYTIVSSRIYIRLTAQYNTLADFKTYLQQQYAAGTPVTVWYVLATEETGIVNEPLMKIGDYADTLSMEQAGTQIPTANGSTTLDVETTVKPSEVYIKYRGEAVATLSSLPAEVSSPEGTPEEVNPEETEEEENGSENVSLQHKPEVIE